MPADDQFYQWPEPLQSAPQAGPVILDQCRAARIDDVTDFAECLVKTSAACAYYLTLSAFRYCVHPRREEIIARTLAAGPPPAC